MNIIRMSTFIARHGAIYFADFATAEPGSAGASVFVGDGGVVVAAGTEAHGYGVVVVRIG